MSNSLQIIDRVVAGAEPLALLEQLQQRSVLYVTLDDARAARVAEELAFFAPEAEVLSFPAWDCVPYDRVSPHATITSRRIACLSRLVHAPESKRIVITTVNALSQRVLPKAIMSQASFVAQVGDEIDRDALSHFLVDNGYVNTPTVTEPGEFALRGGIIDIFAPGEEEGVRLDLFGDTLDTIRSFDPLTQISGEKRESVSLLPASEVLLNEASIAQFRKEYRALFGAVTGDDPLYEAVTEGRKYAGMEHWLPLFYDEMALLSDYLPGATVAWDHLSQEAYEERMAMVADSYATRAAHADSLVNQVAYHPIPVATHFVDMAELQRSLSGAQWQLTPFADEGAAQSLGASAVPNLLQEAQAKNQTPIARLQEYVAGQDAICLLACSSEGTRTRLSHMLEQVDVSHVLIARWGERKKLKRKDGKLGLVVMSLDAGFATDDLVVISEQDVLGERMFRSNKRKRKTENFLAEASSLEAGEVVVHRDHGIGRFEGLETLVVQEKAHDCLKLIYRDGDRLFVPVENMDLISRYGAGEGEQVVLDKLGGISWQQRTEALKKRIKLAAEQLLGIAAKRALNKAPSFEPGESYEAFYARFPYAETEDQERAIEEVLGDLAKGSPMDRLVCGDVGFGKTEVALRAAQVVARPADGKARAQVAVVTPTTLLCRQHYQSFSERFAGTDVKIAQLSRLVSAKQAREVKQGLKDGEIDIVIGTHALLSEQIGFEQLGLLVVDEEQRFGVVQKEALKKLKANTHVLTLTATPIPRTLQLSLAGIRELSLITTAPVDRLAVRTYVMPFDPVIVREAILREHYRGGRSFFVCPRISDIEEMMPKLKELVPEVKIVSAHGQMPADELDGLMDAFYDGKYDVLLATTIVESGLDIPAANTIIIHHADRFGLAQLYQLRGRVGRSKLRAYAYLTTEPRLRPTPQAVKRLEVMQKLDTLGAGFSLASHDMDIRGFGNLLGEEQSGTIKEVGVELYQEMLREHIIKHRAEEDAQEAAEHFSPHISLGLSVMIPDRYVPDLSVRMGLYRRAAALQDAAEVEAFASELIDRFGGMPEEVENYITVLLLKQRCREAGIGSIELGGKGAVIGFHQDRVANPEALFAYIQQHAGSLKLRADQKLVVMGLAELSTEERVAEVEGVVRDIAGLQGSASYATNDAA